MRNPAPHCRGRPRFIVTCQSSVQCVWALSFSVIRHFPRVQTMFHPLRVTQRTPSSTHLCHWRPSSRFSRLRDVRISGTRHRPASDFMQARNRLLSRTAILGRRKQHCFAAKSWRWALVILYSFTLATCLSIRSIARSAGYSKRRFASLSFYLLAVVSVRSC